MPIETTPQTDYIDLNTQYSENNDRHHIEFKKIQSGNSTFNAVVTLSSTDNAFYDTINNMQMFNAVQPNYTAVQPSNASQNPDVLSKRAFLLECASAGYNTLNESEFLSRVTLKRQIIIKVDENQADQTINITITYYYNFLFPLPTTDEIVDSSAVGTQFEWSVSTSGNIANSPPSTQTITPKNTDDNPQVFVVFYPWYNYQDEIAIENTSDILINISLIKQRNSALTESELAVSEGKYSAKVDVLETHVDIMDTQVKTNISKNLFNSQAQQAPVNYLFNLNSFTPQSIAQINKANRLYTVTVELFDIGENNNSLYENGPVYSVTTTNLQ